MSLLKVVFECGIGSTSATASLNSKVTETRDLYLQQCCCVQKLVGGTKSLKIPLYEGPLVWLHKLCFPHESLWHRCVHKSNDISEIGQRFTAKKTTDTQLSKVCWRARWGWTFAPSWFWTSSITNTLRSLSVQNKCLSMNVSSPSAEQVKLEAGNLAIKAKGMNLMWFPSNCLNHALIF